MLQVFSSNHCTRLFYIIISSSVNGWFYLVSKTKILGLFSFIDSIINEYSCCSILPGVNCC